MLRREHIHTQNNSFVGQQAFARKIFAINHVFSNGFALGAGIRQNLIARVKARTHLEQKRAGLGTDPSGEYIGVAKFHVAKKKI